MRVASWLSQHSCLFEAVATFMGFHHETRWDQRDGYERPITWDGFLASVQRSDIPAGLLELEALAH
eukprot:7042363-Prorocentrum_lima.AAC.1